MATIFVYDGHPGGAGITERGFDVAPHHLAATRATVATCPCDTGCPSCVQSPKCGNGNHPLDTAGAIRLTDHLLTDLAAVGAVIVCGGGGGAMAAVCRGAAAAGGTTVGLLPGPSRDEGNPHLSVAVPTGLGEGRNVLLVRASDALVAVGGGFGTLSEIA